MSIIYVAFYVACVMAIMTVFISAIMFVVEMFRSMEYIHARCTLLDNEIKNLQDTHVDQLVIAMGSMNKRVGELEEDLASVRSSQGFLKDRVFNAEGNASQTHECIANELEEIREFLVMIQKRTMASNSHSTKFIRDIHEGMDLFAERLISLEERSTRRLSAHPSLVADSPMAKDY